MRGIVVSLPIRQIALIVTLAVLGLITVSFGRVALEAYQLDLQKQQVQREITALQTENRLLKGRVEELQTDNAIERLARQELGWTRPGDTLVVVPGAKVAPPSGAGPAR